MQSLPLPPLLLLSEGTDGVPPELDDNLWRMADTGGAKKYSPPRLTTKSGKREKVRSRQYLHNFLDLPVKTVRGLVGWIGSMPDTKKGSLPLVPAIPSIPTYDNKSQIA